MKIIEQHIVQQNISATRLSDYAVGIFIKIRTRKGIKKAIKRGELWVNNEKGYTGTWINTGDTIELRDLDLPPRRVYETKLEVVYEDDFIAIINKPGGISVSGNSFRTIQNALLYNIKVSTQADALRLPLPVHRLDNPTCGLLLIAKTHHARTALGKQFEEKTIEKRYQAIAMGKMPAKGFIEEAIDGKPSRTDFKLIHQCLSLRSEWLSFVDLFPKTGRTHQLRKHLAHLGFPIFGDKLYGKEGHIFKGRGLFLCAVELTFTHPHTNKIFNQKIEAPNKFSIQMKREARRAAEFGMNKKAQINND